jgi:hypothetical protein
MCCGKSDGINRRPNNSFDGSHHQRASQQSDPILSWRVALQSETGAAQEDPKTHVVSGEGDFIDKHSLVNGELGSVG